MAITTNVAVGSISYAHQTSILSKNCWLFQIKAGDIAWLASASGQVPRAGTDIRILEKMAEGELHWHCPEVSIIVKHGESTRSVEPSYVEGERSPAKLDGFPVGLVVTLGNNTDTNCQ